MHKTTASLVPVPEDLPEAVAVPQGVSVVTKAPAAAFPSDPSLQNAVGPSYADRGLAAAATPPSEPVLWALQKMDEKMAFSLGSSSSSPGLYLTTEMNGPGLRGTGPADRADHLVKEEAEKASCEAVLCAPNPDQEAAVVVQTYSQASSDAASVDARPVASKVAGSARMEWTSSENGCRRVEERMNRDVEDCAAA